MADKKFDFEELKEMKFLAYTKKYCKPIKIKNAGGGILLRRFKQGGKKVCIFLPFKKFNVAKVEFERIKKEGIHEEKHISLVYVSFAKGETGPEVTLTISAKAKKLSADDIIEAATPLFKNHIKMGLNVVGVSENTDIETTSESSIDTVVRDSTITELREEFQEAQQLYKESKKLDETAKAEARNKVSLMFKVLMPKVKYFLENSDQKSELKTAERIKDNIDKFQNALGGSSTTPEGPNKKLNVLTGGISRKATQLLKDFQSEIAAFDKENEMGESLLAKLESISKIGKAKTA